MKPAIKLTICLSFAVVLLIKAVHVFKSIITNWICKIRSNKFKLQMAATVKLTNAVCETKNKTWITFDRCRLRAINRNKTVLNVDVNFLHPVHTADLNFRMQKKANGYKPWLGEYTVDFCAFMRKSNHPVIKILIGIFKDFSTLNHTCPYVVSKCFSHTVFTLL